MERADCTIGSCAAEPCGNEKISAGETTTQVRAQQLRGGHIGMTELLIFLDYLGKIKGVIKGRDEIRKAALHRCRKKHLRSL